MLVGLALIVLVPERWTVFVRDPATGRPILTLSNMVFPPVGAACLAVMALLLKRLPTTTGDPYERRVDRFLVGWLVLEVCCYFAISPFPAVRRILGMLVVSTLLTGRLASRTCTSGERRRRVAAFAAIGAAIGLVFYAIELRDALAERDVFRLAVREIRARDPQAKIRFVGVWGMTDHAEREGLEWSGDWGKDVRPGEWLIHDGRDGMQLHPAIRNRLEHIARVQITDPVPVSTQRTFYESRSPLVHWEKAHAEVDVYYYRPADDSH